MSQDAEDPQTLDDIADAYSEYGRRDLEFPHKSLIRNVNSMMKFAAEIGYREGGWMRTHPEK